MRRRLALDSSASTPATAATESVAQTAHAPILPASDRIIRLPELLAILQISRTTAYELQKKKILPQSVSITGGGRAMGWKLSDIDRYLASLSKEGRDD